jgi:protein-disulfide isomerase
MEESMCWEIDYKFLAEQERAQEKRIKQRRRAELIDQLLNDANQRGEETKVEGTPAKEVAPAK